MKLFSSFIKELTLASRGFYFYIELFMAVLILAVFMFVIPDNFTSTSSEYIYLDMPKEISTVYLDRILDETDSKKAETVTIKINKENKEVALYTMENSKIYIFNNREDVKYMADTQRKVASIIKADDSLNISYEYFLQGYESDKYKNLLRILHVESSEIIDSTMNNQDVRPLSSDFNILSDKENMLPSVLVFNGALMGLFIIAAYIFLDRQEGVIKAYAITPSPVWEYLMSKIGVLMLTTIVSTLLIVIPIMGIKPDYILLLALLVTSAFFASSLGLLLASFYKNIMQAFGAIYGLMMIMIIPNVAYFMPTWNPSFIKWIPSYPMLEGFKSILLGNGDWQYILSISVGFLIIGMLLFQYSTIRYKKTLVG
jgi:ABC-2 type transport system permease protein